jgi:hypothetical protein
MPNESNMLQHLSVGKGHPARGIFRCEEPVDGLFGRIVRAKGDWSCAGHWQMRLGGKAEQGPIRATIAAPLSQLGGPRTAGN